MPKTVALSTSQRPYDPSAAAASLTPRNAPPTRIANITAHIVASPAYLQLHGHPTHPAQLGERPCFAYTNVTGPWRFRGPDGGEAAVRPTGPLRANNGDALLPALRAGLGIGLLPDFIVGADLASGALEAILTDWSLPPVALHLLTPPSNLRPARVEALITFLAERLKGVCTES